MLCIEIPRAPILTSKHIFTLQHENSPIELPVSPSLFKHLLMCSAQLTDQNFNSVAPEINLAQHLM